MPRVPGPVVLLGHLLMAMVVWLSLGGAASAQTATGLEDSPEVRDQLYEELIHEAAELERHGNVVKKVVRLVKPAVVHIEAQKVERTASSYVVRRPHEEAGSGIIIKLKDRYFVLTNRHVISHAPLANIKIELDDGRRLRATAKWEDEGTDVAVVAVDAQGLTVARLGDSSRVEIGDFVLAVGSPFGLSHSVTYGIISAKGRRDLKLGREGVKYQNFFQTDAAINPGNSGGPLLNLRGEVIAINTAIASSSGGSEGIGFAIPINMFMVVARQLVEEGHVVRSFLGVHLDSRFDAAKAVRLGLPYRRGARVTGVTPESPAETAQFQVDDVILAINNVPIEDDSHLVNLVSVTPPGQEITVVVWRSGERLQINTKVGDRADFEPER